MPVRDKTRYVIRKIEHEFVLPKFKPKFPRMSELYLQLLVNKEKVNSQLAAEKYHHNYDYIVSSDESIKSLKPGTLRAPQNGTLRAPQSGTLRAPQSGTLRAPQSGTLRAPQSGKQVKHPRKETFTWDSEESIVPTRPTSSSPLIASISSERYKKVKKSITQSYYQKLEEDSPKKAPTLKEVQKTFGNKTNIVNLQYEESKDEDDLKRELLFKFQRLKKTCPKTEFPEFNMMSNHENMKRVYDSTVRNLAVDSTVESYKSYLMMGFMGCEVVLGKIGFDMEGYCQQQTLYMNKYEKLLLELGEKSYIPSGLSKWPVEIRLMVLFLFQTTIFVVSKIIAKRTNVNVLQMYNNINGVSEPSVRENSSGYVSGGSSPLTFIPTKLSTSDTKMRGPSSTPK